jgi:tRNA-binding protein|tara:strand:- start:58 stop:399 length:342 start_codon:yes stop_codon:yes gene_type:complete
MKEEISFNDYDKVDIRIGTVVNLSKNEKARKPSLVLEVDFGGEIGIKKSSAQITDYYNKENLVGKQVIGVCNFPEKNIADIKSQFLVLGAIEENGEVVLLHPSQPTKNGLKIA